MAESSIEVDIFGPGQATDADQALKRLSDRCKTMVEAGRKVTAEWAKSWNRHLSYMYDDQLAEKKRDEGWQPIQVNEIYPIVKQEIAVLAQRRHRMCPKPFRPKDPEVADKAEFWKGHLQWRYEKTLRMRPFIWRALLDGKLNGWMIAKVTEDPRAYFDEDLKRWVYQPRVDLVETRHFGLDPNADTPDDARYMYHEYQITVEEAIEQLARRKDGRIDPVKKKLLEQAASVEAEEFDDLGNIPALAEQMKGAKEKDAGETSSQDKGGELVRLIRNSRKEAVRDLEPGDSKPDISQKYLVIREVYFRDPAEKSVEDWADYSKEELLELGAIEPIYAPGTEPPETPEIDEATGQEIPGPEPVVLGFKVKDPEHPAFEGMDRKFEKGQTISSIEWPQKLVSKYQMPKFPFGRVVFMVGDKIINAKEEEQRWGRKHWPFVIGHNLLLPHVPQGQDSVSLLIHAQDLVNYTWAHIIDWLCGHGGPVTYVEEDALPGKEVLRATAQRIVTLRTGAIAGQKIKREPGVPLGADTLALFNQFVRHLQDLGGQHDPTLGGMDRSQEQTATAITVAQQATQVGMGMQILLLDDWVQRIMEVVAELDRLNMKAGDQVRLVAEEDKDTVTTYADEMKDLAFDLDLQVGVALPYDQERQKIDATGLAAQFPGNPEAKRNLLDAYERPDKEKWLAADAEYQEFLAWKAAMEAMAKKQNQAGQAAPAPAPAAAPAVPVG